MIFENRTDAGRRLAHALERYRRDDVVVLGLPRGGLVVAFQVARALQAPLDVFVARKLGVPRYPELAMGAIAAGHVTLNDSLIYQLRIPDREVERMIAEERREAERRETLYRGGRAPVPLSHQTVIVVDDGIATGATAAVAVAAIRTHQPDRIVVAAPVSSREAVTELSREADEVIVLHVPVEFKSVSGWYRDFEQTTDEEVIALLDRATAERPAAIPAVGAAAP